MSYIDVNIKKFYIKNNLVILSMCSRKQSDCKYIIQFILFERIITRPVTNINDVEYLIKWENYDFSYCSFICASAIDNKNQKYTPFFNWNQLTKEQKYERALFCKNWDEKNDEQKNFLGNKYINKFINLLNDSNKQLLKSNDHYVDFKINKKNNKNNKKSQKRILNVNDDQIINESRTNQSTIILPMKSPQKKKRKIVKNSKLTKSTIIILLLATYKNPDKKSIFNTTEDENYFESMSYSEKHYPYNCFVHWIMINKKKTIVEYIQQLQDKSKLHSEVIWLQEKIKYLPFKNYVAYPIINHGVIQNFNVPDYVKCRQNKFKIEDIDINKIFQNNQYMKKLLKDTDINLQFYGVTCDYKMISLIADEKKNAEFRSTNFLNLNDTVYCKTNQLNKPKKCLNIIPHRKDIKNKNVSKKIIWTEDIDDEWKEKNKNFIPLELSLIDIFEYKFLNKIFMSWIFKKRKSTKNLNHSIVSHNRKILVYVGKCYNTLMNSNNCYWRKHSLFVDRDTNGNCFTNYKFTILMNVLIYIFMIPWHIEKALDFLLKDELKQLAVPILNVLGFVHIPICCNLDMEYRFKHGKCTSNYQFKCIKCNKIQSAWNNTFFEEFKYWNPFSVLYHIWKLSNINALQKHQVDNINVKMTLWRRLHNMILLDVRTFCHKYFLICGNPEGYVLKNHSNTMDDKSSENECNITNPKIVKTPIAERDICADHAFIGKNKYGRGYLKDTTKIQYIGFCDRSGIFVNQIVDTQNKIETEYYIKKYTQIGCHIDTDKAKCFNGIFLLQRKHRTVNHSGELIAGKFCRFTNHVTGGSINAQEGCNGRVAQHVKIENPTSLRNPDVFEQYLALHDLRYNRTDNQPAQLFINYLMILTAINPPNQPKIQHEKRKKFNDIYYVENIIGEDKDEDGNVMYLVKWENFPYYKSTWQYQKDFITIDCIKEWKILDPIHKDKLFKRYLKSVEQHNKKNLTQGCIKGFKIYKFYKFIGNLVWSRAINIIKDNNIESCIRSPSNKNLIEAVVKSQRHKTVFYRLTIKFKRKELMDFSCNCKDFEKRSVFGPTLLCKHITAVCLYLSDDKHLYISD